MAVPGSSLGPRAAGTNKLICNGAAPVRQAGDVLEVLASLPSLFVASPPGSGYDPGLSGAAPPESEIARASGLSAARTGAILMELELAGEAVTLPGGMAAWAV